MDPLIGVGTLTGGQQSNYSAALKPTSHSDNPQLDG